MNKYRHLGIVLTFIVLLPLFFVHINNFHDWGDDFAQYLIQAKSITGETQSGLVSMTEDYSPALKGVLFSILLIPATFSDNCELFYGKVTVTISLLLLGFILFLSLKSKTGVVASLLLTCFFVYNYHVMALKDQILPDFIFSSLVLIIGYFYQDNRNSKLQLIAGILALLSIGFRSAGIAVLLAFLINFITGIYKRDDVNLRKSLTFAGRIILFVTIVIGIDYGINKDSGMIGWYLNLIFLKSDIHAWYSNLIQYRDGFRMFFEQEVPGWLNSTLRWLVFPPMILGFISKCYKKSGFLEYFIIIYSLLLLLYPYNKEPIRFLIPLIVTGIVYLVEFYSFCFHKITVQHHLILLNLLGLFLVAGNIKSTCFEFRKITKYGPFSPSSSEMIHFINKDIPPSEEIAFVKPWALAYFTNHRCVPISQSKKASCFISDKTSRNHLPQIDSHLSISIFENNDYIICRNNVPHE